MQSTTTRNEIRDAGRQILEGWAPKSEAPLGMQGGTGPSDRRRPDETTGTNPSRGALVGPLQEGFRRGRQLTLIRGESVFNIGETGEHLFLIERGWIKLQRITESGMSCVLGAYGAGEVIGETCMYDSRRTTSAVAMGKVVLHTLPLRDFLRLLQQDDAREAWLLCHMGRMVAREHAQTLLATVDSEHRLAAAVMGLAYRHGRRRGDDLLSLDQRFTHEEFAAMVGTTRSRIGYFLKQFRQLGLVATDDDGRLVVHEPRLQAYLARRDAA